ncbi:MAG: Beta-galactosidase/beta-glucuronidase [Pedosphaera sp.]|nr:Beta-galactosidase/beta-glucuronidase [Pedosphaera sp.]
MPQAFGNPVALPGSAILFRRIKKLRLIYFLLGLLLWFGNALFGAEATNRWHPAAGSLMTRWAKEVSSTNALPEYPRPQLVRTNWLNLNGLWDYAITPSTARAATNFNGHILVPFPIESALSGVMQRLDENSTLWYRCRFKVPPAWAGQRVRLHFGAVDWHARVAINGRPVGQHRGGYDDFSFDITDSLAWQGDEELVLAVDDPTDGDQPHGKQSRKSENIFYTPTSGIWQTVWLEPVPKICIDDLRLIPDVDKNLLRVKVAVGSRIESLKVEVVALSSNKEIVRVLGAVNRELSLPIPSPHLWSPDDPCLYDLKITLLDGNRVVDSISSYFGMRKIALRKDENGKTRIALNDQFTFQMGALDQGFWPDGLYTAPTDEALRFDIESLKRAGFNLARKHVKVEPDRWYYWCDRLGLLVWQDMPSGKNTTTESRLQFETELRRMVEGRGNHPSIIVWVLFNEGWGQYDTERLVPWVKTMDPSRLIDNASGWTDKRVGDIIDTHSYPGPESPQPEADRAAVLGEFGGLGLGLIGHTWSDQFWGYQPMPDKDTLNNRYCQLLYRVHILNNSLGLSAAIYTQTADVETECNGLMTYDRSIFKLDTAAALVANRGENIVKFFRAVMPNALQGRVLWNYTTEKPDDHWFKPGFLAINWKEGASGFGTSGTPNTLVNTTWDTADIWLRREFTLNHEDLSTAVLQVHHDEDAEIYLNGVLAAQLPGFDTIYNEQKINPEAAATLTPGVNLIAVHCHQTSGGQFIDVGIVAPQATKVAK